MRSPTDVRSPAIDVVRVLAIAFIVYRHTFVVPLGDQSILLSWTVPFFFFLTGWLWHDGSRSWRDELARRWRSLGVPYVSWFTIIWITYVGTTLATDGFDLVIFAKPFAGSVHAARPFTTFWFISALFFVAVFYRLLDRVGMRLKLAGAAALLVIGWAAGPILSKVPLSIGTAVVCVAFVVVGQFLRKHAHRADGRAAGIAGGVLAAAVVASPFVPPIDVKYGEYGAPFVSVLVSLAMCWAVVILATYVFDSMPATAARLREPAARLRNVSMCVILTHPFALYLMGATRTDARWWHYVLALVLPWALGLLLARTPMRRYLVGS